MLSHSRVGIDAVLSHSRVGIDAVLSHSRVGNRCCAESQ